MLDSELIIEAEHPWKMLHSDDVKRLFILAGREIPTMNEDAFYLTWEHRRLFATLAALARRRLYAAESSAWMAL